MSLSKTGQAPSFCQLCEEGTIRLKCQTCNYLLCVRCSKIHMKIKSLNKHKIIELKNIGLYENDVLLDVKDMLCPQHFGQKCFLFCRVCKVGVCSLCIAESHTGENHSFIKMEQEYEISVTQLRTSVTEIDEKIREVETEEMFAKNVADKSKIDKEKEKIRNKGSYLVQAINQQTNTFLADVERRWDKQYKTIQDHMKNSTALRKTLQTTKEETERILESKNVNGIFRTARNVLEEGIPRLANLNHNCKSLVEFIPGEFAPYVVQSLFGSLIDNDIIIPSEIEFNEVKQYSSELEHIDGIQCDGSDGSLWLNDSQNKVIRHARVNNGTLETINTFQIAASEIRIRSSSDILFHDQKENRIKLLTTERGIEHVKENDFNISSSKSPLALYASKNRIAIAYGDSSEYKVIVFDIDTCLQSQRIYPTGGQIVLRQNRPLFTFPKHVALDNNDNIYIVDEKKGKYGTLKILSKRGDLRSSYDYPRCLDPIDMVITPSDNAIILGRNAEIVVVNSYGDCLKTSKLSLTDVNRTLSLAINTDGELLIGASGQKGAKIIIVKYIGC